MQNGNRIPLGSRDGRSIPGKAASQQSGSLSSPLGTRAPCERKNPDTRCMVLRRRRRFNAQARMTTSAGHRREKPAFCISCSTCLAVNFAGGGEIPAPDRLLDSFEWINHTGDSVRWPSAKAM